MPRPRRVARLRPSKREAARSMSGWIAADMGILSKPMSSLLAGKIAVVTGASSGIGRAIAISFASEGASVVIADITEEPLEGGDSTLEIITRAGGAVWFQKTDVGRWDEVDSLLATTVARHGRLDVMVNNAAT